MKRKTLLDLVWLAALGVLIFLGMPIASFHGDETYHIDNSNDYAILFIQHRPQDLLVHSLWESNLGYHRLLDSGVSRYTIGLAWQLAGMTQDDLPDSGYQWGENYDDNLGGGLVPAPAANVVVLMATLLPWQRYSLIPVMSLVCGVAVFSLIRYPRRTAVVQPSYA